MLISALNRKLMRDLAGLKGQLLTISLVVASGVAAFTSTRSTLASLRDAQATFYTECRFADLFVHVRRAPERVAKRLEAIEGVSVVDTGIVDVGSIPLAHTTEPVRATVVSLPHRLNTVYLRAGRLPEPNHDAEVVISDAFADANELVPGDRIPLVLGGVRREMTIVGVGLSPQYVMVLNPADMAMDAAKAGVVYMNRDALAAALDLEGSFNDAVFRIGPRQNPDPIIDAIDVVLEPYGSTGAITRERQFSHYFLSQELKQLGNMSSQVPPLFLLVAAFLLHMVLSRLVQLQRSQIAALKALGYTDREIGLHYLGMATLIVVMGAGLGVALGAWLGNGLLSLYEDYYRFPSLRSHVDPQTAVIAVLVSTLAAVVGTLTSVRSVLALAPAEAMRPAAPAIYRRGVLDARWVRAILGPSARMVLREVRRKPVRTSLSALGIAIAIGIIVVARFWGDAMDYLINVQMHETQRWDVQVAFAQPRPESSLRSMLHLPGVFKVEGLRMVPVRFRHHQFERAASVIGYPENSSLQRVLSDDEPIEIPDEGVVLTRYLGEVLDVSVGDWVELEVQEGDHQTIRVQVQGLAGEPFGMQGHMRLESLHRALGQEPVVSAALMRVDPTQADELDRRLTELPDVVAITHHDRIMQMFNEQSGKNIFVFSFVLTLFGATIVIGVVYNNARVSLSMRSRDLASLRVLGFTRREIAGLLIGELSLSVFVAIPIGLFFGQALAESMATGAADPEQFRFPLIISSRTYAFATIVTIGAALVSAWLVRRRIHALDLIGVLKTRD